MKDDVVMIQNLDEYKVNDQVVFDKVMLMGTDAFTLIGRPTVGSCKVYATVQEQTWSKKKIMLKMRAKKGIRKMKNKKVMLTVLRVDKIDFEVVPELLKQAVAL